MLPSLPRHRNIPGRAIISTCYPTNRPKAGRSSEIANGISAGPRIVARDRKVGSTPEISPTYSPNSPETDDSVGTGSDFVIEIVSGAEDFIYIFLTGTPRCYLELLN